MSAHIAQSLLNRYLDGDLGGRRRAAVQRHLEACSACRREYLALQETVRLVSRHGRQPCELDYRHTAVAASTGMLRPRTSVRSPRPWWRAARWAVACSLAALLALAAGRDLVPSGAAPETVYLARPDVGLLHEAYRSQQALGEADGMILTVTQSEHAR